MYEFAKTSKQRLEIVHSDLRKVAYTVKTIADIDFDVSCGHRTIQEQKDLYAIGRTKNLKRGMLTNCDGVRNKSKHNHMPSDAIDIYVYAKNGNNYDKTHLAYVAGMFMATAKLLKQQGVISSDLVWGGNFNENGYLNEAGDFDFPHIERK